MGPKSHIAEIKYNTATNSWIGKRADDKSEEKLTQTYLKEWLSQSLPQFYEKAVIKKEMGVDKYFPVDVGASYHNRKSPLPVDGLALPVQQKVDEACCLIVNTANILWAVGDDTSFKRLSKCCHDRDLFVSWSNKHTKATSDFGRIKNILSQCGYKCTNLGDVVKGSRNECCWPIVFMVTDLHCVGVWKNQIFDAYHSHSLKLNKKHLDWCCGDGKTFLGGHNGFSFEPASKKKKAHLLNNSKL